MKELKHGFSGERMLVVPNSVTQEIEKDQISSLLYITDIGYFPNAKYHHIARSTPISQYVFIYCVNGTGWFSIDDETYSVSKNQYFILPANIPHSYGSTTKEPWTIYWLHFKGRFARYYAEGQAKPTEIKSNIYSRISGRIELFEEMFHTLELGFNTDNILYSCSVFHHFLGTLNYLKQYRNAGKVTDTESEESDIVAAAIHYMKENIETKVTLADISKYVGYSQSYFSMVFSKRIGYPPTTYFNMLKIQKACQMLDLTDMKINQICHKIGIDDCYYFSRLFSKIMNISPREYKKRTRG